jgi:methyl-accepting chemotaxis protein
MTSTSPPFRRKAYFINPALQSKYLIAVAAYAGVTAVLLAVEYYFAFGRNSPYGPWNPDMVRIFLRAHWILIAQLVVFTGGLTVLAVLLSHRVAGPVVNLKRCMEALAAGDYTVRAKFREKDELKELADAFNVMAEALGKKQKS